MKRINAMVVALVAFVGLVAWSGTTKKNITSLPVVHAASPIGCSTETVAGNWGFTLTGTLLPPTGAVPVAAVGTLAVNGAGNISGTEARSVGGGFANETITGTWTVNPDCTATGTVKIYESGALERTSGISLVFDENSTELRLVQQSLTLPDGTSLPVVLTGDGKRMFPQIGNQQ